MLEEVIKLNSQSNSVSELSECVRQGIPSAVFGVSDAFKCFLLSNIENPVLYVVKDNLSAHFAVKEIEELTKKKVVYLPPKDINLSITRAFSKENTYQRIIALSKIEDAKVIVVTVESLLTTLPKSIKSIELKKGEDVSMESVVDTLISMGYVRVESVEGKGSFSVRGDVLDVYSINDEFPIRIDFFGDTVESIKKFDGETRKSLGFINSATVLQANEFIFDESDFRTIKENIVRELDCNSGTKLINLKNVRDDVYTAIDSFDGDAIASYSVLSEKCGSVFDVINKNTLIVIDEAKRVDELGKLCEQEFTERFNSLSSSGNVFSFLGKNFLGLDYVKDKIKGYRLCAMQSLSTAIPFFNPLKIINPKNSGVANYRLDFNEVFQDINNWLFSGYGVLVCTGDRKRSENFCLDLSDKGIASCVDKGVYKNGVSIISEPLENGFIFHEEKFVVIGSGNLYGKQTDKIKAKSKRQNFFTAPERGDYCVHEVHGIGKVLGNKKISTTEGTKDYVSVEYSGGDVLYVPVEQMDILTRYLGGDKNPKLSKIGGADFEKIKRAVKESIKKMSFDLKKLYSEREALTGFKYESCTELEKAFESAFPFEETIDQAVCDKEIKEDMSGGKVMDRLVCGDVGFGKTEVAFRAIFRAIVNGKQAAMLAPTTILTEQHYNNAKERFKDFGVRIECLNRFKSPTAQKKIIEKLKSGEIDFIIGTHRLLGKDVGFKDLGILVLDEEQRFGVEHKEKIKLLKNNVDALTLTATPIPRTLHMSLSGIRSISVINTPPKKRLPVQVYVTEESEVLIKDAIIREKNRGGQSFILYNRVDSIFSFSERIRAIMPDVKITVVHGRMDEKVLESSIMAFYRGESDVLISTTIIENGIDLPRANTLIVIDADNLGLSTLYQLKGRVGRSDKLAYAYFTFKKEKILSQTAFERLNAIIEFTEMGSGIKIAMRDLEIRGAGNILGAEQHGHMDKIGYELYSKLLREEISGKEEIIPDLDVRLSAFIPESYIESETMRMDAYKEIAEINSEEAEKEFTEGTEETYGPLPEEVKNLVLIAVVKSMAMRISAREITVKKEEVSISFEEFKALNNEKLLNTVDLYGEEVRISMSGKPKLYFKRVGEDNVMMLKKIKKFLAIATN